MPISPFFRLIVMTLIVLHLVGPGLLWAMEQRGVEVRRHNQAVVSGIRGSALTVLAGETTRPVRFSEPIAFGEQVRTARDSSAEVLINNQAVVTMLSESDVALEERDGHTVVHLSKGSVLVSAAASALREGQTVIVETPGAQLSTRGGLLKATVGTEPRQTKWKQESEGGVQLVSYSPIYPVQTEAMVNERFEVYEGTGTIGTRTAGATPLIIEPGQSVQMTGGTLGTPGGIEGALAGPGPMVLAATRHAATPQAGLELVSARQLQQVSALQQALYGDPDATVEGKESQSGTIISTLFGTNPTQAPPPDSNNPTASLFGTGSPYTAALLNAINRSGAGVVNDSTDSSGFLNVIAVGRAGPLVETPIAVEGGLGLLTIGGRSSGNGLERIRSAFGGSELLSVDGGDVNDAPHGGRAPISTLAARGLTDIVAVKSPPVVIPINDAAKATIDPIGTRLTADGRALSALPYEVTIVSIKPLIFDSATGQLIVGSGTGKPFLGQVDTTFDVVNLQSRVKQTVTVNTSPGGTIDSAGKLTKLSTFLNLPEGLTTIVLNGGGGELKDGQKFTFADPPSASTRAIDGNRGVVLTARPAGTETANFPDPSIVIIPGKQDNRAVLEGRGASSLLDTEGKSTEGRATADFILSDFSSRSDGKVCSFCISRPGATLPFDERASFIDAAISARSSSSAGLPIFDAVGSVNDRTVELTAGVVLTEKSSFSVRSETTRRDYTYREDSFGNVVGTKGIVTLPPKPSNTKAYFQRLDGTPEFEGSVAAIVANENNSAFVKIHDRVLAVLDGSSITPDVVNGRELRTSLLSVLDSQLIGPETPSSTDGKLHRELVKGKAEISPLLEVEDSAVRTTSAVVVRATASGIGPIALDRALLDASSPILTVTNSQFTATGHLIDLAGVGPSKELLRANLVPGDALVRLNGKTMDVAGNFLNLARTSATVNGYLFSLANAGTLNIGGTLLSLTGNSILRLNSDAFGIFDHTANTFKITNTLCASGECGLLTDHLNAPFQSSNGKAIQVAGSKSNVQLPQGFTPFRAPSGTTSSVVLDEHAALLHIEPGSELHISVPLPKK